MSLNKQTQNTDCWSSWRSLRHCNAVKHRQILALCSWYIFSQLVISVFKGMFMFKYVSPVVTRNLWPRFLQLNNNTVQPTLCMHLTFFSIKCFFNGCKTIWSLVIKDKFYYSFDNHFMYGQSFLKDKNRALREISSYTKFWTEKHHSNYGKLLFLYEFLLFPYYRNTFIIDVVMMVNMRP